MIWKCSLGDINLDDFYNNIVMEHIAISAKVISNKNQKDAFEEINVSIERNIQCNIIAKFSAIMNINSGQYS